MENTVIDRIKALYKKECGSIPKFSERIGVSTDTMKNVISRGVSPSFDIVNAIAINFPEYSLDWLITG